MLWARPSEVLFYSLSSAGPHAAHQREGAPPAALNVTVRGATDNRAASRVALEHMEVAREGSGFQYVGVLLPLKFSPWGPTAWVHCARRTLFACGYNGSQHTLSDVAAPRQTLGPSAGLCVRCFQPSHSLRSCSSLVCCSASLCPPCAVAVLFCLRTCVLLCPRISLPGPLFRGRCRHRGFA